MFLPDYDKECCEKECPCASQTAGNCFDEPTDDDKNFDLFMKLFKPQNSEDMQKEHLSNSINLTSEEKTAAEGVIEQLVEKLNAIILPN